MKLKVTKDLCEIKENEIWNVGDYNVHTVQVELSPEFNGLVNKVRYFVEDNSYDMLITDSVAQVPYEATVMEGTIKIGVYGYDADTDILVQSTSPVNKYITSGTYTGDADNTQPLTPTDKEQMETAIQKNTDDITDLQNNKQNVLISGENIKTINNESILGSGNLDVGGSGGTSDYTDLTNKPKINNIELKGNKTLSDLGIQPAGNYALKSEIPTVPTKVSAFTNDAGYLTTHQDLTGYVKNTDYSTYDIGGVVKISVGDHGLNMENGTLKGAVKTLAQYNDMSSKGVISKGTLENVITGKGLIDNTYHDNTKQDTIIAGNNITIESDGKTINATDTTYSDATTSASGLMSSSDKTKLNGIASGAEVNVQANWNETNTSSDAYIQNKPTIPSQASDVGAIASSQKGSNGGVAELDANGKVPSSQLPSYVDDVLEYTTTDNFPTTGETGKIYIATNTNLSYRWTGTGYTVISPSLALGETSSTAYRGDRGKVAYTISQMTSGNPHNVTKSDVGLGNVENKSSATIRGEITSTNVTSALGYTPYDASNPNGYTSNTGTYSKPSGGIPKSDLASAVQTSLGKADSSLQEHQTLKTINSKSILGSGNVSLTASDVGALSSSTTYVSSVNGSSGAVTGLQTTGNKVTTITSSSTDTQYPSAKAVWTLFNSITDGDGVSY